ncbi:MAG: aminopeptidase P N-terminal domain-containing protein [Myxococcales bacterium]|nr:aminopeptidase P N-terminal domain-containing protein [Myxococcales bacterium]
MNSSETRSTAARRARLAERHPGWTFLLPAAPVTRRNASVDHAYRADSDVGYLCGFDEPDATLLLRCPREAGRAPQATLFVRPRDARHELWLGPIAGPERAAALTGIDDVRPSSALWPALGDLLADLMAAPTDERSTLAYRLGLDARRDLELLATLETLRARRQRSGRGLPPIVDPHVAIGELRLLKDEGEIARIRRAAAASAAAHHAAMRTTRPGDSELVVAARLRAELARAGAEREAYLTIVAGGERAQCLHASPTARPLAAGELVLVDAACELDGYASDITRTWPVGPRFEGAAREHYEIVLAAQRAAIDAVRPGTTLDAVHDIARAHIARGFGLAEDDKDAIDALFPHRTSHLIGRDVHDAGLYRQADGSARPLEPGMVFSVEPGAYRDGIGVRIEDMVLVTDGGCEVLTASVPKAVTEIEALRREAFPDG